LQPALSTTRRDAAPACPTGDPSVSVAARARSAMAIESLALLALLACALFIRYRWLTDIPRYTDEVDETMSAIDIDRRNIYPLVSPTRHVGAYFDYLLAGVILISGKSPDLARSVALVTGLATVLLTYGYARRLGGRVAGFAGVGLLAASAPHVLLSSRVAWSASLTPLLVVAAVWALDTAVSSRRPALIAAAEWLIGLAFQAHPSVVALLPRAGDVRRDSTPLAPSPPRALRLRSTVRAGQREHSDLLRTERLLAGAERQPGVPRPGLRAIDYFRHAPAAARGIVLAVASAVDLVREPTLDNSFVLFAATVCFAALVYAARRASLAPSLVVLSALVCLPLLQDDFDPLLKARYTMPLVPLTYIAVGVLIADLLHGAADQRFRAARAVCGPRAWVMLTAGFLASLSYYETETMARGCTNAPQRALVGEMDRYRLPDEWLLLDQGVVGSAERLGYLQLLEWSGRKVANVRPIRGGIWDELSERPSFLTVVNERRAAAVFE
jgi:hypothetical protein